MRHFKLVKAALLSAVLPIGACHHDAPPTARVTTVAEAPVVEARVDLASPVAEKPPAEADPVVAEVVEVPPPDDLVQQARAALDGNDVERAYALAKKAVIDTPERWTAWNTLGRVQLRKGQNDAALDSFEQAVETDPSSAWAHNNFGLTLLYDERYAEAVEQFEEATKIAPSNGLMRSPSVPKSRVPDDALPLPLTQTRQTSRSPVSPDTVSPGFSRCMSKPT